MIFHAQLGMSRALVDTTKHRYRPRPWMPSAQERGATRPVACPTDVRLCVAEEWKLPRRRLEEIQVREATPADIAVFARVAHVADAVRHPGRGAEQQGLFA